MIVRLPFSRRELAKDGRELDRLARQAEADRRERLYRASRAPSILRDHVVVEGATIGIPGLYEVKAIDQLVPFEHFARLLMSRPRPLSSAQRSKIKKR